MLTGHRSEQNRNKQINSSSLPPPPRRRRFLRRCFLHRCCRHRRRVFRLRLLFRSSSPAGPDPDRAHLPAPPERLRHPRRRHRGGRGPAADSVPGGGLLHRQGARRVPLAEEGEGTRERKRRRGLPCSVFPADSGRPRPAPLRSHARGGPGRRRRRRGRAGCPLRPRDDARHVPGLRRRGLRVRRRRDDHREPPAVQPQRVQVLYGRGRVREGGHQGGAGAGREGARGGGERGGEKEGERFFFSFSG
mgnify:CR=1 FL=1